MDDAETNQTSRCEPSATASCANHRNRICERNQRIGSAPPKPAIRCEIRSANATTYRITGPFTPAFCGGSVCRQNDCWGEKHVSVIRSVLAQQRSTDCTLRTDLRGIAKAVSLCSPFRGGAPFSRKSLLRSVGLTSRSAWKHASPPIQLVCPQFTPPLFCGGCFWFAAALANNRMG